MLFGLMGQLGARMKQAVGIGDCPMQKGILGVDMGHCIVTNGDFVS